MDLEAERPRAAAEADRLREPSNPEGAPGRNGRSEADPDPVSGPPRQRLPAAVTATGAKRRPVPNVPSFAYPARSDVSEIFRFQRAPLQTLPRPPVFFLQQAA